MATVFRNQIFEIAHGGKSGCVLFFPYVQMIDEQLDMKILAKSRYKRIFSIQKLKYFPELYVLHIGDRADLPEVKSCFAVAAAIHFESCIYSVLGEITKQGAVFKCILNTIPKIIFERINGGCMVILNTGCSQRGAVAAGLTGRLLLKNRF